MQKEKMKLSRKALGLICALALLIGALYVPMAFSVSAAEALPVTEDTTTVFGFEDSFASSTAAENKAEFDATGVGYMGWGGSIGNPVDDSTNKAYVAYRAGKESWFTFGAYRLNKKVGDAYQVYNLKPNSTYVVSMKVRVTAAPEFTDDAKTEYECYVSLGYGARKTGTDGNYSNAMSTTLTRIVSVKAGSAAYTLVTENGNVSYDCGNEWQDVIYQFTTPADLGAYDHALALYAHTRGGFRAEIDDLSVTKLGANTGVAILTDEYSGTTDIMYGEVGSELTLPDVSDRAQQADHIFEGWYADADRTEKIEKLTYTKDKQIIYTAWKAPVSITFIDKFNDTTSTITGMAGENFNYPADPVDPEGKNWFMGWYTTEGYTEEHTSGKYGFSSIELYAYFKSEVPGLKQDFENYPYGKKEVHDATDTASGVVYKKYKDNLAFGNTMTLQSDVTASSDSKTAVKFVWDSTKQRNFAAGIGIDDPTSYDAATRYKDYDNFMWLGSGIENNQAYTVTFKVKVEKLETDLSFYVLSAISNNGWGSYVRYENGHRSYTVSDEWQTVSFSFNTNFKTETATTMYLGVRMNENKDTVLYFDDVVIEANVQPYESIVMIDNNYNDEVINLIGKRGDEIKFPTLTNPNDAPFLGWYLDENCTQEAEFTTYPRKNVTIYAKWGAAPVKFNEAYTWDDDGTSFFTKTVSIEEGNGVGYDDDYALKFRFNGTDVYTVTEQPKKDKDGNELKDDNGNVIMETVTTLMHKRYKDRDHVAAVAKGIKDGSLYHVSYYYKASDNSNVAANIKIGSGYGPNVWVNDCWKEYSSVAKSVPVGDEGWIKVDFYFVAEVKSNATGTMVGNTLYMLFGVADDKESNFAELYVDNVLVEEIDGDYIYFHGNASGAPDAVVAGKAGDSFTMPKLDFGKSELLGFFIDEDCNFPFTATTIPEGVTHVYASWSLAPISFKNDYPFITSDSLRFGKLLSIEKASGIGTDDDYALRWKFVAKDRYNDTALWASRASQFDHVFTIAEGLKDGAVYHITYDYMATSNTNVNTSIIPVSGGAANIWWGDVRYKYDDATVVIPAGGTGGWKSADFYISANVLKTDSQTGDALFLLFNAANNETTNFADIRVDNVKVEVISAPYAFFDCQNGNDTYMEKGKIGEEITYPANPTRFGHSFTGWYTDKECTEKFTLKTFAVDTAVTVYAGWKKADTITYSFEKFDLINGGGVFAYTDCEVEKGVAKSGKQAVHFGNRTTGNYNAGASFTAIAQGKEIFKLERGYQYIVNVNYNAKKVGNGNMNLAFIASNTNFWAGQNSKVEVAPDLTVSANQAKLSEGKWANKTFVIDTSVIEEKVTNATQRDAYTYLYLRVKGAQEWDIWFDDITITKVPKGSVAVCIDNAGYSQIPTYLIGREGQSYSSKLPDVKVDGKYFKGYYTKDVQGAYTELTRENMVFKKEAVTIFARFLDYEVTEDFEGDYAAKGEEYINSYTTYDFDYEIYDATKAGNSKDNVTSGNYSLHRKGESMYFENAVILTLGNQIAEGERYTVSFKVKLGDYKQTDGAVKVVSGRSFRYAWTTTGDYYPVVAIKDLLDGQWHEVSYTFNSVEAFACIQTPGYVELFMDDFKFTIAGDEAPLSTPVAFTEYVPAKRDAEGNLIEVDNSAIDVTSIIDISLYTNNTVWIWIVIAAAAVLVIGGGVFAFILIKKKKQGKA